jgi:Glycosyltransferase family 25 (LPS biosynthesis protein)
VWGTLSDAYVITLPQIKPDRYHYICTVLQRVNVPALLWPAFPLSHPATLEWLESPGISFNISDKEVAIYLAHREIWHSVVARRLEQPVLVLEDDVQIEENFVEALGAAVRRLPDDWAALYVGHCFEEHLHLLSGNETHAGELEADDGMRVAHRCASPAASRAVSGTASLSVKAPEPEQLSPLPNVLFPCSFVETT